MGIGEYGYFYSNLADTDSMSNKQTNHPTTESITSLVKINL